MPTLFRFLTILGILIAVIYGVMFALANFVEPITAEMSVRVPLERLEQGR